MKFAVHAKERMAEMDVDITEVLEAVRHPELHYPGSKRYPDNRMVCVRGRLAVVVDHSKPDVPKVVTVLWHRAESRQEAC